MITHHSTARTGRRVRAATALAAGAWLTCAMGCQAIDKQLGRHADSEGVEALTALDQKQGAAADPTIDAHRPNDGESAKGPSDSLADAKSLPAVDSQTAALPDKADTDQEFNQVIAELQSLGAIDPLARQRLIDDLKKTDPALWPPLIQYFRASLAQQRGAPSSGDDAIASPSRASSLPPLFEKIPDRLLAKGRREETITVDATAAMQTTLVTQNDTASSPSESMSRNPPASIPQSSRADVNDTVDAAQHEHTSVRTVSHTEDHDSTQSVSSPEPSAEWRSTLNHSITALEADLRDRPAAGDEDQRPAQLRLLLLAAGRRDDALRPASSWTAPVQQFWSEELFGLATCLDTERNADSARRSADAARRLGEAAVSLGQTGSLVVRNLAFCTDIKDFGLMTRFEHDEFKPGGKVLLYAEVENFVSNQTPRGYHTALTGSYQIFDNEGRRVDEHEFSATEEWCQSRRRDFFIPFVITLPENAFDGKHTLRLTIEDTLGKKIGQSTIDFTIRSKRRPDTELGQGMRDEGGRTK